MAITNTTFAGQTMTPQDFAILVESLMPNVPSKKLYGCKVNGSGATITISDGWAVIRGRIIKITATTKTITLPSSGSIQGLVYIIVDLANVTTPADFVIATGTTMPSLPSDTANFNENTGKAYLELGSFSASTSAITSVSNVGASSDSSSTVQSGYIIMEGGLHLEWGTIRCKRANNWVCGPGVVTFKRPFSREPWVFTTVNDTKNASEELAENSKNTNRSTTQCYVWVHRPAGGIGAGYFRDCFYFAIGY